MGNDFSCCGKHERKCDEYRSHRAPKRPYSASAVSKSIDSSPTPSFPATFEGVSIIPRYWSAYESNVRKDGLFQALLRWKEVRTEVERPADQIQWEAAHVKALKAIFTSADKDCDGNLKWASGEVRSFVRSSFESHSLPAPPLCENVWLMLYREVENHGSLSFDFKKCTGFLVHVAETLHSLITGESIPVEIAPLVYVKFRPSSSGDKAFPSKDVPAAGDSLERRPEHDDEEGCATMRSTLSLREPEPEQEQELENEGASETTCKVNKKVLLPKMSPGTASRISDFIPGQKSHLAHMRTVYQDALLEKLEAMASKAETEAGRAMGSRAMSGAASASTSSNPEATSAQKEEAPAGLRHEQDVAIQALLARQEALRERELRSRTEAEEREAERQKRRAAAKAIQLLVEGAEVQEQPQLRQAQTSAHSAENTVEKVALTPEGTDDVKQPMPLDDASAMCEAALEKATVAQSSMDELSLARTSLEAQLHELKAAAQAEGQSAADAKELRKGFEDLKARALDFERQCLLAKTSVTVKRASTSAAVARAATADATATVAKKSAQAAGAPSVFRETAPRSKTQTSRVRQLSRRGGA